MRHLYQQDISTKFTTRAYDGIQTGVVNTITPLKCTKFSRGVVKNSRSHKNVKLGLNDACIAHFYQLCSIFYAEKSAELGAHGCQRHTWHPF